MIRASAITPFSHFCFLCISVQVSQDLLMHWCFSFPLCYLVVLISVKFLLRMLRRTLHVLLTLFTQVKTVNLYRLLYPLPIYSYTEMHKINSHQWDIYIYALCRYFYPKQLLHSRCTFYPVHNCILKLMNFALLCATVCSENLL